MIKEAFLTFLIPLVYLLAILIILKTPGFFSFGVILLGLIITFAGLLLWVLGFLSLGGRAFSVLPKAKILKTSGVYKYFRHPIYLGITLTCLGLSLSLGSKLGLLYTIFIIIPLNIARARKEERILTDRFGQEYLAYKAKTLL